MTLHPLALVIALVDTLSLTVCFSAAFRLFKLLPEWQPESSEKRQLKRERDLELSLYQGRFLFRLQAGGTLLVILAISNVWPRYVPGAMCGTGVLQAMGTAGGQALIYRALVLFVLFCWWVLSQLDAHDPSAPLTQLTGRVFLLSVPLLIMSMVTGYQALLTVAGQEPVSCCAVVYDRVYGLDGPGLINRLKPAAWMIICLLGALPAALWAAIQIKRPLFFSLGAYRVMGGYMILWVGVAMMALQIGFSAYIYEVLQHPCPWCLFLPEHGAVGFVLYGSLAVIAAECTAGLIARAVVRNHARLTIAACDRLRRAGVRLLVATVCFVLLAAGPAVIWRIRFGVWLH
jgi:hypothetical protein